MADDIYRAPDDSVIVTRMTGPANEGKDRRRYQITLHGQTDNCGKRHAWVVVRRGVMEDIMHALQRETF